MYSKKGSIRLKTLCMVSYSSRLTVPAGSMASMNTKADRWETAMNICMVSRSTDLVVVCSYRSIQRDTMNSIG